MPRRVKTLAQNLQLKVYAFRDESSSAWGDELAASGEVFGVINVGGGVDRISFIDEENLLSGSSSSLSLSDGSFSKIRGDGVR